MNLKNKIPELRVIVLMAFAVLIICTLGVLLYKNLSSIARNVTSSVNTETQNSLVVRQIAIQIREAENYSKSYYLTRNSNYLSAFYFSLPLIEKELEKLGRLRRNNFRETLILDSVGILTRKRFDVLRQQLYLGNEEKITEELNTISKKIDESFSQKTIKAEETAIALKDTFIQKEGFFNKLFGRKEKRVDTIRTTVVTSSMVPEKQPEKIQGELKSTIKKVKTNQIEKITEYKQEELQLSIEAKKIMDRLRDYIAELEQIEKQYILFKIQNTNNEVNNIKALSIISSGFISFLLILICYLILNYLHKKNQYEIALLQAKLHAEDLAKAKETFLANMSHEIKTPLNAIYGFTEQVLESDLNHQQKQQLSIVKKSADHLTRLVNNILSYSKLQAGKLQTENIDFDLKKELFELEMLFSQQIQPKRVTLYFEIDPGVPDYINCDLTRFTQVLFNLIGNAIKFTETGSIRVVCGLSEKHTKPMLNLKVIDTGIGISTLKIPQLFNEYEQVYSSSSKKYGGTGLGLVITKKLIEQIGGTINLTSEENKGTTVEVTLPFTPVKNERMSTNTPVKPAQNLRGIVNKKILVVDDEDYNRLLLKTIFRKQKLEILEASNGEEAIDMVKTHSFDLILMDIRMPVKNGIEACTEMRAMGLKIPILASTAVINDEKVKNCINAGFSGFIYKPFSEKELLAVLSSHFNNTAESLPQIEENTSANKTSKLNFTDILEISNGDKAFEKELIGLFHKSINEGYRGIIDSVKHKKWLVAADAAHKMMSPCKHFDADELYNILKYFDNLRNSTPDEDEIKIKVQELKYEVEAINSELRLYL